MLHVISVFSRENIMNCWVIHWHKMSNKKDAGKSKRRGKGGVVVPDFANLEPRSLTDKQGSMYVAFQTCICRETPQTQSWIYPDKNKIKNPQQECSCIRTWFVYSYWHILYILFSKLSCRISQFQSCNRNEILMKSCKYSCDSSRVCRISRFSTNHLYPRNPLGRGIAELLTFQI